MRSTSTAPRTRAATTPRSGERSTLRLGHIAYSNCLPVHAELLGDGAGAGVEIVEGVPTELNRKLVRGEIDLAPASSIEFARHADRYRILPDLVIGSRGPVRSILFVSDRPPPKLGGATIALPTASATSLVLLRILLRSYWGVEDIRFVPFEQQRDDPRDSGATAALFIGDVALRKDLGMWAYRVDLGEAWTAYTGLPFAFAVWQTPRPDHPRLGEVHRRLVASRDRSLADPDALAQRSAAGFDISPDRLASYWRELAYDLNGEMVRGLERFYREAAAIGELPDVPALRWAELTHPVPPEER